MTTSSLVTEAQRLLTEICSQPILWALLEQEFEWKVNADLNRLAVASRAAELGHDDLAAQFASALEQHLLTLLRMLDERRADHPAMPLSQAA